MSAIELIGYVIQIAIGYNLVLPLVLFLIWKALGKERDAAIEPSSLKRDYAIVVTAYQYTDSLPAAVDSILKLNYTNYLVYIVADNCDISSLDFRDERVVLLRPPEVLASNTASHFYAMQHFRRNHTHITIIDSDNLVDSEYLNALNAYFDKGFLAVQGLRVAKNLNSPYACLDATRDIYYSFYDGKVLFELGSSATLAGSGMAFSVELYRPFLETRNISGAGFDKVLQHYIVKSHMRIAFTEDARVFDEKTSRADQLVNQRSRWINTWFKYFSYGFSLVFSGIKQLSMNQFLFGLILLRPPLFLFILLSGLCMLLNLWMSPVISVVWLLAFLAFICSFFIALRRSATDPRIYKSLSSIPRFMFLQVVSLLKARGANKRSVATRHYHPEQLEEIRNEKK